MPQNLRDLIAEKAGGAPIFESDPVMAPMPGKALFTNTGELASLARELGLSMGEAALASEAALLGASEGDLNGEMGLRLDIMLEAVKKGLAGESTAYVITDFPKSVRTLMQNYRKVVPL